MFFTAILITYIKGGNPAQIYHNPSWKENQRQNGENFWIRELQTLHPEGINN
jgi:hypothetical protein